MDIEGEEEDEEEFPEGLAGDPETMGLHNSNN